MFKHKNPMISYFLNDFIMILILLSFFITACIITISVFFSNNNVLSQTQYINTISNSLSSFLYSINISGENANSVLNEYTNTIENRQIQNHPYTTNLLINSISDIYAQSEFIDEIAILSKTSDIVFTTTGTTDRNSFFNNVYYSEKYSTDFWEVTSSNSLTYSVIPSSTYYNRTIFSNNFPHKNYIVFLFTNQNFNYNILIFVSEDKLFNKLSLEENINIALYNNDNNKLFSNNTLMKSYFEFDFNKNEKTGIISKGLTLYSYMKLENGYVVLISKNYYTQIIALSSIIIFILLLLYCFMYIKRRITDKCFFLQEISHKLNIPDEQLSATAILDSFKHTVLQLSKYEEITSAHLPQLQKAIFKEIINKTAFFTSNKYIVEFVYKNVIYDNYYYILIICFKDKKSASPALEYINTNYNSILLDEYNEKYTYLIAANEPIYDTIKKDLPSFCFKNAMPVTASLSNEFTELKEMASAYRNADLCALYHPIKQYVGIITMDDINTRKLLLAPTNLDVEISSYLLSGNVDNVKNYIKKIITENESKGIPAIRLYKIFEILFDTLFSILITSEISNDDLFKYELQTIHFLDEFKITGDLEKLMMQTNNILFLYLPLIITQHGILNQNEIIRYISTHFNEELYLENISSIFKTTPKYFSNFFKKNFSIGFVEYLTSIRIAHAKEYLSNTNLQINEIAIKVGYQNASAFISAFKRSTGMTPKKFKSDVV